MLEALLVQRGAEVIDGVLWRRIRKYRAGGHRSAEVRNVLGLALLASERGLGVVFLRDRDRDEERQAAIEDGIRSAGAAFPKVRVAGGCAVESIEAAGLWALGDRKAEEWTDPKAELARRGHTGVDALVDLLTSSDLRDLPEDSHFARWLRRVDLAVSARPPAEPA